MIPLIIFACCILHNICIDNEDEPFNIVEMENRNNNNYAVREDDEKKNTTIIAQLLF